LIQQASGKQKVAGVAQARQGFSKNRHATKHFQATKHPIMQSFEPGEDWRWCYVDNEMV
jgi:hypothetical protein